MSIDSIKVLKELKKRYQLFDLLLSRSTVSKPGEDFKEASKRVWNSGLYLESFIRSKIYKRNFQNINTFCIFVGYSRSGHSIIGSLLDAHSNIIISHEINPLYFKEKKFSRDQIFSIILENSKQFAKMGRGWSGYSYQVVGQWQGKFTRLKVIGDKMGGWTSHLLRDNDKLLDEYREHISLPLKCIHHIRNPFDNISRMALVLKRKKVTKKDIDYYFSLASTNHALKRRLTRENYFEGKHEDFISNPERYLTKLCNFLNVSCSKGYLKACDAVVNRNPSRPRFDIVWHKNLIKYANRKISKYDFLVGYKY
jgi:hypothetical protein